MRRYFIQSVSQWFDPIKTNDILSKIDWFTWINGPGLPPVTMNFETNEEKQAIALAHKFINKEDVSEDDVNAYNSWFTELKAIFIQELLYNKDAPDMPAVLAAVDDKLAISTPMFVNSELLYLWY